MIILPNWGITRKVMQSYIPFVLLAAVYIYLFVSSITPENAAALSNPKLADIARFFADETAAATGWIHFLVMDLFVGRYTAGPADRRPTSRSLPPSTNCGGSFRPTLTGSTPPPPR
jgi:hypothetical protein